jgi:hypothetical protein
LQHNKPLTTTIPLFAVKKYTRISKATVTDNSSMLCYKSNEIQRHLINTRNNQILNFTKHDW